MSLIQTGQAQVAGSRERIARFGQKIQATLARVWGETTPETLHELHETLVAGYGSDR